MIGLHIRYSSLQYQLASKTYAKRSPSWPYAFCRSPLTALRTAFDYLPFFLIKAVFKRHSWLFWCARATRKIVPSHWITSRLEATQSYTGFWVSFLPWHHMLIRSRVYNQVAYQMRPTQAGHVTLLVLVWVWKKKKLSLQIQLEHTCYKFPNLCQVPCFVAAATKRVLLFRSVRLPLMK